MDNLLNFSLLPFETYFELNKSGQSDLFLFGFARNL